MLSDEQIIGMARAYGVDATRVSTVLDFVRAIERAAREGAIEECCATIKAEDDRVADEDYNLDSDDCMRVIRALLEK